MTKEMDELKEEVDELKEDDKNIAVKLTWTKLWAVIVIICGTWGGIFSAGYKVSSEVNKVANAKIEMEFIKKTQALEIKLSSCTTRIEEKNKEFNDLKERNQYLRDRVLKLKKRLKNIKNKELSLIKKLKHSNTYVSD